MTKQPTTPPADRRGLALTAGHDAAALYCEGVDRLLCLARGAAEHLESAVQEDPHFDLAWAALALAHLVEGHADLARAVLLPEHGDRVAGDPATPPLTPRERGHLAALAACVRGDDAAACRLAQRHLREYPRDVLVFACLVISAQAGDLAARQKALRFAAEIAPANGDDWAFLMLHARLLDELGRAAEALPLALRALTLRPECAPAARIVAQAHHERGDHRAGLKLLGAWLRTFIPSAPAVVQLRHQEALLHLAQGDARAAIQGFERWIRPAARALCPGALLAAAALLWRFKLDGHDLRPAWDELRPQAAVASTGTGSALGDLHVAFALAGARDLDALDRLVDAAHARADRGDLAAGGVVLPIALGLRELVAGEYAAAAERLEFALGGLDRLGGAQATRALIEDTLIEASLCAGRFDAVERWLEARIARREAARDMAMLDRARTSARSGEVLPPQRREEPLADSDRAPSTPGSSGRRGSGGASACAPPSA